MALTTAPTPSQLETDIGREITKELGRPKLNPGPESARTIIERCSHIRNELVALDTEIAKLQADIKGRIGIS